jgi:hypothetical protein
MKVNRENVLMLALFLALALVIWRGVDRLYQLAPHPTWCLCDVCHEQFDNERKGR